MAYLRMKKEYIDWTKNGFKTATTRTKEKKAKIYELISGSRYKPIKSGIKIQITTILPWKQKNITEAGREMILKAENFTNWTTFIGILNTLNKKIIGVDEELYTHFYIVLRD